MELKRVKSISQVAIYLVYSLILLNFLEGLDTAATLFHAPLPSTVILQTLSIVETFLSLALMVMMIVYAYRLSSNNRVFCDDKNIEFRPGWTVGVFFIPILSLYKPYYAFKEFMNNISGVDYGERGLAIGQLRTWWILHIIGPLAILLITYINEKAFGVSILGYLVQVLVYYYQVKFLSLSAEIEERQIELLAAYSPPS
jgi:hypothetical protein